MSAERTAGADETRAQLDALIEFLASIKVKQPVRMAGTLLREFGCLSSVLAARPSQLRRVLGGGPATAIIASRQLMLSSLDEEVRRGPVLHDRSEVVRYLRMQLGGLRQERVLALYLDVQLRLLRCDTIAEGGVDGAAVDIPRLVLGALDAGAKCILLVHNHPAGDPNPSNSDVQLTNRIKWLLKDLELRLVDHIIVTAESARSMMDQDSDPILLAFPKS